MRLLCKFPTRERPKRFEEVLAKWNKMADDANNLCWLFSFDDDDPHLEANQEWANTIPFGHSMSPPGLSKNKIHAINRDIEKTGDWDILIVISDDMVPVRNGWDSIIKAQVQEYAPDGDGLFWWFDGKQADIITLPIMGRKYYDRFGYVYHPDYISVFADNEQTDVARDLRKLFYFSNPIAHHMHPSNFEEVRLRYEREKDTLHARNETKAIWDKDFETYQRRKAQGFPA